MVISVVTRGVPGQVQVAAMRTAACLLSKDSLVARCEGALLLELERAVLQAAGEDHCGAEMKSICAAVLQAMGSANGKR